MFIDLTPECLQCTAKTNSLVISKLLKGTEPVDVQVDAAVLFNLQHLLQPGPNAVV